MLILTIAAAFLVCANGAILQPVHNTQGRVVGGNPGEITNTPYLVSLLYDEFLDGNFKHICGGSIISLDVVLTAANCTDGRTRRPEQYRTRAGSNFHNAGGQIDLITRIVQHSGYSYDGKHDYDISLIFLTKPLVLGSTVAVIDLPSQNMQIFDDSYAEVTGWGLNNNLKPDRFNSAYVQIFNQNQCASILTNVNPVTYNMVCAIGSQTGPCDGDEGGPLVIGNVIVGITSWRNRNVVCGSNQYPAVYTRVPAFRNWISENMRKYSKFSSL